MTNCTDDLLGVIKQQQAQISELLRQNAVLIGKVGTGTNTAAAQTAAKTAATASALAAAKIVASAATNAAAANATGLVDEADQILRQRTLPRKRLKRRRMLKRSTQARRRLEREVCASYVGSILERPGVLRLR